METNVETVRAERIAARRRDLLAALREARTLALELFRIEGQPYAAALVLLCDATNVVHGEVER